jgi:hypothetical protein
MLDYQGSHGGVEHLQFDGSPSCSDPDPKAPFWWGCNVTAIHLGPSPSTTNATLVMTNWVRRQQLSASHTFSHLTVSPCGFAASFVPDTAATATRTALSTCTSTVCRTASSRTTGRTWGPSPRRSALATGTTSSTRSGGAAQGRLSGIRVFLWNPFCMAPKLPKTAVFGREDPHRGRRPRLLGAQLAVCGRRRRAWHRRVQLATGGTVI